MLDEAVKLFWASSLFNTVPRVFFFSFCFYSMLISLTMSTVRLKLTD